MATPSKVQFAFGVFSGSALAAAYVLLRRRRRAFQATVTQLVVFPVKGCRGVELETAKLNIGGIEHDREWMIVQAVSPGSNDAQAKMLTSREFPRMATIQPMFTSQGNIMLCTDDGKSICVGDDTDGLEYNSVVWRSDVTGIDQGDDVSAFLSSFLGCSDKSVRLIRMRAAGRNLADCSKYGSIVASDTDQCESSRFSGFSRYSDWGQLSIISNQSLEWLNRQNDVSCSMSNHRFRMNIVVDASAAFAEDHWYDFSIGEVECRFLKRCGRCLVATVDPSAGTKDPALKPLTTLKRLRAGKYPFLGPNSGTEAFLGINLRHLHKPGQCIRVGDRLLVAKQNGAWW